MVSDIEYTLQMIYLRDTKFNEQKPKVQNPAHGEVYSMQLYVIKFVSDVQLSLVVFSMFPPPIKLIARI